jgi:hypothetical protein
MKNILLRNKRILVVLVAAMMMAGGLVFVASCSVLGCVDRYTCTNTYSYDCGMSGCYSRTHYGYTCDC